MADTIVLLDEAGLQASELRACFTSNLKTGCRKIFRRSAMNFVGGELKVIAALCSLRSGCVTIQIDLSTVERFELRSARWEINFSRRPSGRHRNRISGSEKGASPPQISAPHWSGWKHSARKPTSFQHRCACWRVSTSGLLDRTEAGHRMEFVVNLEKSYFFDESTGKSCFN